MKDVKIKNEEWVEIVIERVNNTANLQREVILIVDDAPNNVRLLTRILESVDYPVVIAQDGYEALEQVATHHPSLILLDIQMPGMDGFEVCQRLKADPCTSDIPIIFISALTDIDDIVHALSIGGSDYVTKPFKLKEVLARVENQLTVVRQHRQIAMLREQDRRHFEALDKMKTEFVQMATHDLKNPLGVILGFAEILRDLPVEPTNAGIFAEGLTAIEESVDKMRSLVADMLELAQIQTGVDLTLSPASLAAFLEEALRGFDLLAGQQQIELVFRKPPQDIQIAIDKKRMVRVIDNLVSNAIKYTPQQGRVSVEAEINEDEVIIRVSDNGLGIPPESIPRLFDAFYRVKTREHSEIEGTGLGLSVVKTIVDQHDGEIAVESTLGQGSVFSICLPRC
jgi:two-component system sensor histidine kinase/response regulator